MTPVAEILSGALQDAIRRQPLTPAKVSFAWSATVGPAIDRVTRVELRGDGLVHVHASSPQWRRALAAQSGYISARLAPLLGDRFVGLRIVGHPEGHRRPKR
jgi:hypothetical protein